MDFNLKRNDKQHWYLDHKGMIRRSPYYKGENMEMTKKDSMVDISNSLMYFDNGYVFMKGIKKCIVKVPDKEILEFYRYPEQGHTGDFSLDQFVKLISCLTIAGQIEFRSWIFKYLRRRISQKFILSQDIIWWIKALKGSRFHTWLFCVWNMTKVFTAGWNWLVFKIAGFYIMSDEEYKPTPKKELTKRQLRIKKLHYKARNIEKLCEQIYTLPDMRIKRNLQKWLRNSILVDKTNYSNIMLLGGKVSKELIDNYKPFLHNRKGAYLRYGINQMVKIMPEGKFTENNQDIAMLEKLYKLTQ